MRVFFWPQKPNFANLNVECVARLRKCSTISSIPCAVISALSLVWSLPHDPTCFGLDKHVPDLLHHFVSVISVRFNTEFKIWTKVSFCTILNSRWTKVSCRCIPLHAHYFVRCPVLMVIMTCTGWLCTWCDAKVKNYNVHLRPKPLSMTDFSIKIQEMPSFLKAPLTSMYTCVGTPLAGEFALPISLSTSFFCFPHQYTYLRDFIVDGYFMAPVGWTWIFELNSGKTNNNLLYSDRNGNKHVQRKLVHLWSKLPMVWIL